ncbi:MAG: HAMP domain-containing histidine kinase [bacterium]|nr:HAMP domain-containing histidine kinase [bacterium]
MSAARVDLDFDALARLVSDAIAMLSVEGTVSAWSDAAAALTGISREAALGNALESLFARVEPPLGFALVPVAFTVWTNDERRRALEASALSVSDGWMISFGAQQRYDAIDQLKNEIVTTVSHELKTPIASIKAFATTMRENPEAIARERDEYLATIEHEADRLAAAVDALLLAGRVDARHLLARREPISAEALLDRALERIGASDRARVRGSLADVELHGDPDLLALALANLLDNAVKFSGGDAPIDVEAARDGGTTSLRVRDRGIGIAAEHLPYIFERFYRVERPLTAATGGYGLGLFVVREIAHAHGGAVDVASAAREGTTFTLRIPERA